MIVRTPRHLFSVFVRLRANGKTVLHGASGSYADSRKLFGEAQRRNDCDQVWTETYTRMRLSTDSGEVVHIHRPKRGSRSAGRKKESGT